MVDKYLLYTVCDVMFMDEVTEDLVKLDCRYFAVAREFDPKHNRGMNTAVMLMIPKSPIVLEKRFRKCLISNLGELQCWDQSVYQWFYTGPRNFFCRNGWDRLPLEFNWQPYWGDYSNAKVVHFHGPKPVQRDYLKSWEARQVLRDLAKGSYDDELCIL